MLLCVNETWRFIARDILFIAIVTIQRSLAKLLEIYPLRLDLLSGPNLLDVLLRLLPDARDLLVLKPLDHLIDNLLSNTLLPV